MKKLVSQFVKAIIELSDFTEEDSLYLRNIILSLVGEEGSDKQTEETDCILLKEELLDLAQKNGKIGQFLEERECLGAELMNFMTPVPSQVNKTFWKNYKVSPENAISAFYDLSKASDYIKVSSIAKNIAFKTPSVYGDLEVTINLSKPEKDPKAIAAAKLVKSSTYPLCQLCMENEGYQGRLDHPARANHRIIRMNLGEDAWGFQYSPYAYFNEHCIFLDQQHVPMIISQKTFDQLLAIVDIFPGYFVGSNSDLPIVGGSILSHNHYQGGRHDFPMALAQAEIQFRFKGFSAIEAELLKWPMSVIRIKGDNSDQLSDLAELIRTSWCHYSDPSVDIVAHTDQVPHHTVTPIARKRQGKYELDIVLRDNHTSSEFPDGVYHPHKELHHIKKENIGLIEVMGLAILPPRLKDELLEVEKYLLGEYNNIADYHLEWAEEIKTLQVVTPENVHDLVHNEVGKVFVRVLEDAGVYKQNAKGKAAFMRFVESIGIEGEI